MNEFKRSIYFAMLKYLLKRGNTTIVDANSCLVPPHRANYQLHGYQISMNNWHQTIVVTAIDPDKPQPGSATSAVRNMLSVIGFEVKPVKLAFSVNKADLPMNTKFAISER